MTPKDIAIAGCGPAGLAAALLLHRDGHRVRLYERFDTPRPIGSGLLIQPTGLAVLEKLGLDGALKAHGAHVDRLLGKAVRSGATVLDVRYSALGRPARAGIGIHRSALFAILHDAVLAEGIEVHTACEITASEAGEGGRRTLILAAGRREGPYDLLVDALGTRTPLAPPTGKELEYGALWASLDWPDVSELNPHALEQRYRAASIMAGVLPIGTAPHDAKAKAALFWSIKGVDVAAWRTAGLEAWIHEVRAVWPAVEPLLEQITDPGQLVFARYSHRTLERPGEAGLIHIGDAWHSASPQLGQGANMALLDAYALALGLRGGTDVADAIARAIAYRRFHVWLYQVLTAFFTPVYQSDSRIIPFLRDRLVGPVSKVWPAPLVQAALVSGLVGAPLGRLDLA
ncbi:MAG: FAD-dependent oxidoreductase [Caulobacterales bacterium]|uniref:FAD-dependent oxidoreductase n=1 Tax=Glycocaulis sp. TaxID=1969725 RepID=UPI003FA10DBC